MELTLNLVELSGEELNSTDGGLLMAVLAVAGVVISAAGLALTVAAEWDCLVEGYESTRN